MASSLIYPDLLTNTGVGIRFRKTQKNLDFDTMLLDLVRGPESSPRNHWLNAHVQPFRLFKGTIIPFIHRDDLIKCWNLTIKMQKWSY